MITFQFLNVDELYLRMCIDFKTDGQDCGQDKKFCRGTLHGHSKEGWRLISNSIGDCIGGFEVKSDCFLA